MDVKKAIENRRSIRKYEDKDVPKDLIDQLLDAARLAPSGNNAQPWLFKIITSKEDKLLLKENKIFKQDFVYTAPVLIVCCADPEKFPKQKFEAGFDDSYKYRALRDLGLSSQNIVLRATELGLGTCYIGWMDKPKIKKILKLPSRYVLPYVITVGYPAETPAQRPRKNIDEILIK